MGTAGTAQQYHNDWIHWEPKSRNPPGVLHCWRTTRHPASSIVCWGTEDRESTSRSQDQEALILSLQPLLLSTLPRLSLSLSLFLSPGLGCRGLSLSFFAKPQASRTLPRGTQQSGAPRGEIVRGSAVCWCQTVLSSRDNRSRTNNGKSN